MSGYEKKMEQEMYENELSVMENAIGEWIYGE